MSPDDLDPLYQDLEATFGIYKDCDPEHLFRNFTGEDGMEHVKKARKILSSQAEKAKGRSEPKVGPSGNTSSGSGVDSPKKDDEKKRKRRKVIFKVFINIGFDSALFS